jgi:hypothetical protein
MDPTLSQMNPAHNLKTDFFKIHFCYYPMGTPMDLFPLGFILKEKSSKKRH